METGWFSLSLMRNTSIAFALPSQPKPSSRGVTLANCVEEGVYIQALFHLPFLQPLWLLSFLPSETHTEKNKQLSTTG